jgi:hypothetical protein
MELLQFIIFSMSYSFMSINEFIKCVLIFLFLKINYENKILEYNPYDNISVLMNLIKMTIHFMVYQMVIIIKVIKQYNFGNRVICTYNKLNFKYIELKNKLLNFILFTPIKFLMNKLICYLFKNKLNFNNTFIPRLPKTNMKSYVKLETTQDINNFLDELLDEN